MRTKLLSGLESQIMEIIWQDKKCSVRNIVERIQKKRTIAYTTVATILQRLYVKGLVDRKETNKQAYVYFPKLSKKSYSKKIIKTFLNNILDSFGGVAIASFAEGIESLPENKKKKLLKLLKS